MFWSKPVHYKTHYNQLSPTIFFGNWSLSVAQDGCTWEAHWYHLFRQGSIFP